MLVDLGLPRQDPRFAEHGDHTPAPDAPLVLVACSGGRDSMALAAVAGIVCASWGIRCGAVVVDHRLATRDTVRWPIRPDGSRPHACCSPTPATTRPKPC